jgi:hypothetical protein
LRFRPVRLSDGKYALIGAVIEDQIDPNNQYSHHVVLQFIDVLVQDTGGWRLQL